MRVALLTLVLFASACDDDSPDAPASETAEVESSPAEQLADAVIEASGDLDGTPSLEFRFVVQRDGERVFEAYHRLSRSSGRDRIGWTDSEGRVYDVLLDIEAREACGTVAGEPAEDPAALAEVAYGRFINDTYWLLMPLKLRDPGVVLQLEEPGERDGKQYEILRLSFDEVGLTPGDVYWVFVDPDTKRIERWEMQLEGTDGPPRSTSWTDYRQVGTLMLAHDHVSDDGSSHVLFEDVRTPVPIAAFDLPGC